MAPPGPVLCVAPAGSGKTTTLVARIAWRVAIGADPTGICAVTFNRRAAVELRERLDAALEPLGVAAGTAAVRTFHALGMRILRSAGVDVSRLVDRAALITRLAGETLPPATMRLLDDAFSRLTLDPARGPGPERTDLHAAYAAYRAALAADGAIDMDDLVAGAVQRLRDDPALLHQWRQRARVLLVDESQDLDQAQLDLVLLLTGETRDVFLVGDDDQTIYAWRLADVRRILGLAALLPGMRRVDLTVNYRCPPDVVRRADRLVSCVTERFIKRIDPAPGAEGTLLLAPDPGDDVARARRLLDRWVGREPGGYAILARTNRQLAPYAAVALEQGVAIDIAREVLTLDHPVIDRVLELTAEVEPSAPLLLRVARAVAVAGQERDLDDLADEISRSVLAWAARHETLEELRAAIGTARAARGSPTDGDPAPEAATTAREPSPAREAATTAQVGAIVSAALVEATTVREASTTVQEPGPTARTLILATAHGTKGLEFDHVAVVGMDEGSFPSDRSIAEADDPVRALDEERRLAYVAWTRARRELLLVHDPYAPSVFLREAFDLDELWPAAA